MRRGLLGLLVVSSSLAGCALPGPFKGWDTSLSAWAPSGPKPWEKGTLAKPEMTMGGDALDQRYTQHVYQSKEAAAGGGGVGGGGCGCN
jgi:hypothetical protein